MPKLNTQSALKQACSMVKSRIDESGVRIVIYRYVQLGRYRTAKPKVYFYDGHSTSPAKWLECVPAGGGSTQNGICCLSGQMYTEVALTDGYVPDPKAGEELSDGTIADKYCLIRSATASAIYEAGGYPLGTTGAICKVSDPWSEIRPRVPMGLDLLEIAPHQDAGIVVWVDITQGQMDVVIHPNPTHKPFTMLSLQRPTSEVRSLAIA